MLYSPAHISTQCRNINEDITLLELTLRGAVDMTMEIIFVPIAPKWLASGTDDDDADDDNSPAI